MGGISTEVASIGSLPEMTRSTVSAVATSAASTPT